MRRTSVFVFLAMVTLVSVAKKASADLVVPSAQATTPGNYNNGLPFFAAQIGFSSSRVQQVYSSNEFSSFGSGTFITALAFRDYSDNGSFADTDPSLTVFLGATSKAVDGLSTTYSDNITGPLQLVYVGAWSTSGSFPASGPRPFNIVLTLQTPYFYNPSNGNLLFDVTDGTGGTGTPLYLDAQNTAGDSVSRVFFGNSTSPTGVSDSVGLVTDFIVLPEPQASGLLIMALGGSALLRRRRSDLASSRATYLNWPV